MTKDYGEIICTAVDEIVRARISSLEFNVTKTCTIIDISSRKQGKYGVSDGSVSFIALSEDTTYNLDDSVLVLIPNGDYKNDKLILSKINKETELPYNYTSPMSMMVTLTDNVLGTDKYGSKLEIENEGLLANEPAATDEKIGTSVVLYELTKNLDQLNGFTRIGLSVDFKSLLNNLNVHSGTYGVFIEIHSKAGEQGTEKDLVTILPFDCNEMAGNPYNFTSFFTQEKVFDISYIQNIQSVQVVFYQGADFKDAQGELVPYQYTEFPSNQTKNYNNNLFASNVKMYFGQGVNEFDKETITLYTNDVPSYHYSRKDEPKTLHIRWVHKVNDNTYTPLSSVGLDTTKYEVRWYRYNSATTNIDEYAGESWERIGGLAANTFSMTFIPDVQRIKEKIKVIGIVRDGSVVSYSSNVLELTNEEYVPDQAVFDVSDGLSIGCLDDTSGNYFLYDQNGYLNNSGLGLEYLRSLAPLWKGKQIDYDTFPGEVVDYVQWWFPVNHTMIVCNEESVNTQVLNGTTYKIFEYRPTVDWDKNNLVFDYSIKGYWAKTEANNTIRCVLSKNGVEYTAIKELQFGRAGSNGTNLTMVLEFMNSGNALVLDTNEIINYQQELEHLREEMQMARLKEETEYKEQLETIKKAYGKKLLHYSNNQKYQSAIQALHNTLNRINDDYANHLYDQISYEIALAEAEWHCHAQLLQQSSYEQYQIMLELMYQELQLLDEKYRYGEFENEKEYQKQVAELKAHYYEDLAQFSSQIQYQNIIQDMAIALDEIEEAYNNAVIEYQEEYEELMRAMEQQYCQALSQSSCFGLGVEARLYDSNGSRIDFTADQAAKITWEWFKESDTTYMTYSINQILNDDANGTHSDSSVTINWNPDIVLPATLPTDNYFILKATYKEDELSPGITAFLPIPIKTIDCSHIEGAKEVIYNHQGIPSYYRDAYKAFAYIYDEENKKWVYDEFKDENNQSIPWILDMPKDDDGNPLDGSELPQLKQLSKSDNHVALSAPQFFVEGQNDKLCASCAYWSQPILIMQSRYDFETLNSWDESLTIDENNGTILSTMLGAGKKVGNVFSGVLIGDLLAGTDLQTAPRHTGVYGFSEGQMSFGFKDDGTAFIGKSGKGQILFDGNQGTIKSNNIDLIITTENEKEVRTIAGTGLLLDMDDAHISIRGQVVPNSKKTYFDVWRDDKELIHISDGGYYLQSAEFGSGKGFKIDLENGSINANNFALTDSHGHNLLYAGENAYYLQTCGFTDGDEDTNPSGMQIDLDSGRIVAYDFTLSSVTPEGNYKGSNLVLSSGNETMGPSMSVHLKNAAKNYDLDLFVINDQQFIIKSPTWFEGTVTITVNTPDKYYCKSGWNIRNGPNGSKIGFVSEGFYTELFEKEGEWQKIKEKDSEDSNEWWVYEDAIDTSKKIAGESGEKQVPYGRGLTLNIGEGYLLGYNNANDTNAILLDTRNTDYGLQLGPKDDYNLQLGWDGSLMGGSSFKWSIAKNGEAKFDRLIANGGELKDLEIKNVDISYAYIYSGTIGSCSINSNGIASSRGGWAFTTSGATLPADVYFGGYKLSVKPVTIMDMWWRPKAANTGGGKGYIVKASSNSINYKDHDGNNQTLTFTTSTFELAYETRWKGTLIGATEISNEGTGG